MANSGEMHLGGEAGAPGPVEHDQLLRVVRDVAVKVNETSSVREVLGLALRRLCECSGWQAAFAYRREDSNGGRDVLEPAAGYYSEAPLAGFHDEVMSGSSVLAHDLPGRLTGNQMLCTQNFGRAISGDAASIKRTGFQQLIVVPVESDGIVELVMEFFTTAHSGLPDSMKMGIQSVVAQLEHMLRRERAYRLLERQSRQVRNILQAAADAILTVREDGAIEDMNPAAERLFGVKLPRAEGRQVSTLLPGLASELPTERILETIRSSGGLESEARDAAGNILPVHVTVSESLADSDGSLFILAVRDFSAIRSAQQREVHQERLAAMGEMMTALAHESRNALQRIQSCLTLLELRGNPEVLSLVDDMQSAQDHLQRLYEEVRSFAAPLDLSMKRVDLAVLLEATWQDLKAAWQGKGLAGEIRSDHTLPEIAADPEQISQVMRNVLENAVQASPEGGSVEILLTAEVVRDQRCLKVEVRDQGDAVPADVQQRAFDLLFSTKRGGTGMGLAIARRIVQEHGGDIALRSAAEQGTSVVIRLPVGEL